MIEFFLNCFILDDEFKLIVPSDDFFIKVGEEDKRLDFRPQWKQLAYGRKTQRKKEETPAKKPKRENKSL